MKKILTLILSLMMTMSLIGCSKEDKAVAVVNEKDITLGNYEKLLALNKSSMESYYGSDIWSTEVEEGKTYEDTLKDMVADSMVASEVIYQESEKEKVAPTDKEVQEQIDSFNESVKDDTEYKEQLKTMGITDEFLKYQFSRDLANQNLQENYAKSAKITDDAMKKYYEENKDAYYTDTVTASHILIKTQDDKGKDLSEEKQVEAKKKAEEVLAKVNAGEDFATLAKKYSDDTGSAESGGELGTYGRENDLVKEFSDASFNLKSGEVSGLVKTQFGYHIIKCTERIDKQETYEDVKSKIKSTLTNEKYNAYVEKLQKAATIEIKEDIVKSAKF